MRGRVALMALSLLGFGVLGCGGSASRELGVSLARSGVIGYEDRDDGGINRIGRPASSSERTAIIALVRRYIAAALVTDGRSVCRLLYPGLVRSLEYVDRVDTKGRARRRGSCAPAASRTLREAHSSQLAGYLITGVRVGGEEAYVLLNSPTQPAGYLTARRDGAGWTIDTAVFIYLS
jgi:hypothetical protein